MTKSQNGADERDRDYMQRALHLAERGLYDTAPNPTVGCVLVNGDEIVGEGWTAPAGGPHAERGPPRRVARMRSASRSRRPARARRAPRRM
jgi:pyrimidine deaminase RibD-like protein